MKGRSMGGPVYSSERGRMCPFCAHPQAQCVCRLPGAVPKGDGFVRVRRETKGRGGKAVTVILGAPLAANDLASLAKELKNKFSCGGSVKDSTIELQGDHRDAVVVVLQARGWKIKLAGG